MNETKHTPGPWPIERRRNAITAIGPCMADEYGGFAWLDVSKADAGLIAAAPELLAALESIASMYDYEASCGDLASRLYEATCLARAAIAKAEAQS